ncbi:MAG: hypothetical protein Q4F81_04810 [Eubacteriales bacterium]|nr:hypothetical protein [Eubacteriales bacterium]
MFIQRIVDLILTGRDLSEEMKVSKKAAQLFRGGIEDYGKNGSWAFSGSDRRGRIPG